jgi:tRNA pseudouridine55 synthase
VSIRSPDRAGILNVNKPKGWTSHDVVAKVRRLSDQKRVGHAGTLDPLAEGVLPVLLGRATRLADFIQSGQKTYRAVVRLGVATETDDGEGEVISSLAVPPLSSDLLRQRLASFEGEILQTPPRYSALKVAGQRAYAVARAGGEVDLAPRRVTVYDLTLVDWTSDELTLDVTCSRGTYVRALARDIAVALGTVGHLAGLTRTRVGSFVLSEAVALHQLAESGVAPFVLPASCAIPDAPSFSADADQAKRLANGQAISCEGLRADSVWVYDPDGLLVCLAAADGTRLRPRLLL